MADPTQWTPEQAAEATKWVLANPGDTSARQQLQAYNDEQGRRQDARDSLNRANDLPAPTKPGIAGYLQHLPFGVGGGKESHYEPTEEEFNSVLSKVPTEQLPPGFDKKQALQDYRDAIWAQAYDRAAKEGRGITRVGKTEHEAHMGAIKQGVGSLEHLLDAYTLPGMSAALRAGYASEEDLLRNLKGEKAQQPSEVARFLKESEDAVSPEAAATIGIVGGLLPGSALGRIGSLGKELGIGAKGASRLSNVAKGAGLAAATGAGAGLTHDLGAAAEEFTAGHPVTALQNEGQKSLIRSAIGAPFGLLGLPMAQGESTALRTGPLAPKVAALKEAGGGTDFFRGVRMPKAVTDAAAESGTVGGEFTGTKPERILAHQFSEKVNPDLLNRRMETLTQIAKQNADYLGSDEAIRHKLVPTPYSKALVKEAKGLVSREGNPIPHSEEAIATVRDALKKTFTISVANTNLEAERIAMGEPGTEVMTLRKARALGLVDDATPQPVTAERMLAPTNPGGKGASPPGSPPAYDNGSGPVAVFVPKKQSPRDFETQADLLNTKKAEANEKGATYFRNMYDRLLRATYEVRDKYPRNRYAPEDMTAQLPDGTVVRGFGALKRRQHEELNKLEQLFADSAGVKPPVNNGHLNVRPSAIQRGIERRAMRYKDQPVEFDKALEDIANDIPGGRSHLFAITTAKDRAALEQAASITKNLPLVGSKISPRGLGAGSFGRALLFHLDPLYATGAKLMSGVAPGYAGSQYQHTSDEDKRKLLELADQLQQGGR